MAIDTEDSKLFKVLEHVFGRADESASLLDAASGSGMALARELHRLGGQATPADLAVLTAHFDSVKTQGIEGEVTLSSLRAFVKKYKREVKKFQYKISTVMQRPCTLAGSTSEHDQDLFHVERTRPQLLDRSVVLECVDSTMRDLGPPQPSTRQERRGMHKLEVHNHGPC